MTFLDLIKPARILFLRTPDGALRDDVSTDEITPVHILSHYDQRLARFPYTGFRSGNETPIGRVPPTLRPVYG